MNSERWQQIEEIFQQAVELTPGDRDSFLLRATGDDPGLRREVDSLLEAHESSGEFLEEPAVEGGISRFLGSREAVAMLGHVGPYKVLRRLGEGGMSEVFLAVRDDDEYQKLVALKVIRHGMDRADLRRRFRTERQILASLDHPNIAKLLDGGTTEDGLPYFVMDYIEGVTIDEFCNRNRLSVAERLELFRTVCSAVQYAHQNLVVHRDLKPGNILVTSDGVPRLLDFGIAKLLKPEQFPVAVEFTQTQMRPMTPFYASPEQVQGHIITTSSDVYSLGVLLYKLLIDRLPYQLKSKTPREVEKAVLEQVPERPSIHLTRLETESGAATGDGAEPALEEILRARRAQGNQLRRSLGGDLDNVVLMALRKEPKRRYASVEQFAEDIRRYLMGLPVIAHQASVGYLTLKFLRRNRLTVGAAAAFAVLLVAFTINVTIQARRLAHERDQAQQERDRAEQVVAFLQDIFHVSDPEKGGAETITAREILDRGARRVERELSDQPAVQATLMEAIGNVYRNLGLYDWARPQLEQALEIRRGLFGESHPSYVQSLNNLGVLLSVQGEFLAAEPLLRDALNRRLALYGEFHARVAESLNNLGKLSYDKGDYPAAEELYRRAVTVYKKLGSEPQGLGLAESQSNLAILLSIQSQFAEAEQLFRSALGLRREAFGGEHPAVADSLNDLAVMLGIQGRYAEAEPLVRDALEQRRRLMGDEHLAVGESLNNLGRLRRELLDFDGAESLYRESLEISRKRLGSEHPKTAIQISNLALVLQQKGELDEAEILFREALATRRRVLGDRHQEFGISTVGLGGLLLEKGQTTAAEALLRQGIDVFEEALGADHWRAAEARSLLGATLAEAGRYGEARPLLEEAYQSILERLGPDHRRTVGVRERLERLRAVQRDG